MKGMRRFDQLTIDLGHALVVCDLTQIQAEGVSGQAAELRSTTLTKYGVV